MKENMKYYGIKLALVTTLISGFSIFINKFAVDAISQPLVFTTTKNSLVGLFLIFFLLKTQKIKKISKLKKEEYTRLFLIGLIGGAIPFYLFFTGLSLTSAINAAIIHKTLIFWVALLAIPLLKERLTLTQLFAVFVLFFSNAFIGGFKEFRFSTGELMILGATLCWAVENIIAKNLLKKIDVDIVSSARMIFGSLLLIFISILMYPNAFSQLVSLSAIQWFWITATSITLLGYVLTWYRALKYAPAITVTSILVGSTVITNLLSALFITHTWNFDLTAQSFIIAGVLAVLILNPKKIMNV